MKKIVLIFSLIGIIFLSCNKDDLSKNENSTSVLKSNEEEPIPPEFESTLPAFPAEALFLIQREYETFMDNSSLKSRTIYYGSSCISIDSLSLYQYTEIRLLTLYPETAYEGMVNEMIEEATTAYQAYNEYLQNLSIWELSQDIDNSYPDENDDINSIDDLIDVMDMTSEEETYIESFDLLARDSNYATIEDINNLIGTNTLEGCSQKAVLGPFLYAAALTPIADSYSVITILICRDRALNRSYDFTLDSDIERMKRDACRHIYVNMLLRRYLTEVAAWFIMDGVNEAKVGNPARDKYMDLHNNYVGRHSKYALFRGNWANDMYNWQLWGQRVSTFVDNHTGNGSHKIWPESTSTSTIKSDESNTSKSSYIWYTNN